MAGEAGLIMCTWPRGEQARLTQGFDYYFNECMNGFEYQVAGHMIWEGLVREGLTVARAVHDRYHPARRNPWNEVECGDHYARSMASYGVYLAACGYEYHGPRRHLGFTLASAAEADSARRVHYRRRVGSFAQDDEAGTLTARVQLKWGRLALKTLALHTASGGKPGKVTATLAGRSVAARLAVDNDDRALITFYAPDHGFCRSGVGCSSMTVVDLRCGKVFGASLEVYAQSFNPEPTATVPLNTPSPLDPS